MHWSNRAGTYLVISEIDVSVMLISKDRRYAQCHVTVTVTVSRMIFSLEPLCGSPHPISEVRVDPRRRCYRREWPSETEPRCSRGSDPSALLLNSTESEPSPKPNQSIADKHDPLLGLSLHNSMTNIDAIRGKPFWHLSRGLFLSAFRILRVSMRACCYPSRMIYAWLRLIVLVSVQSNMKLSAKWSVSYVSCVNPVSS